MKLLEKGRLQQGRDPGVGQKGKDLPLPSQKSVFDALAEKTLKGVQGEGGYLCDQVDTFRAMCEQGIVEKKWNMDVTILNGIANIDQILNQQLNEIFQHQRFKRLEATWRGIVFLLNYTRGMAPLVRCRLLDVKKEELLYDFERSVEFDQSALFKLVYEFEFGTFGGDPFGVLVGDYEFSHIRRDLNLLRDIAGVVAAAHVLFVSSASPLMFDKDRFEEVAYMENPAKIFARREWKPWNAFRKSQDSRYVVLTMPRILLRFPYERCFGKRKDRLDPGPVFFKEKVSGVRPDKYLWGNAAYAFVAKLCQSFFRTGFFQAISGIEDDEGVIRGLPVPTFDAISIPKMSVDVMIPDLVDRKLSSLGFVCLLHRKWSTDSVFYGRRTVYRPRKCLTQAARSREKLSCMVPEMLLVSRFAHYLKRILREKVGTFKNRQALERSLNRWLARYCAIVGDSESSRREFPLRTGRIELLERLNEPGAFQVLVYLVPNTSVGNHCEEIRVVLKPSKRRM